jgi:hypothetical protein
MVAQKLDEKLDSIIETLCMEVRSIKLEKDALLIRRKWVCTENHVKLQDSPDYETALSFAINDASFKETDAYKSMEQWLTNDPIFSIAPERAGYYGLQQTLIERFLYESTSIKDENIIIDPVKVKSVVIHIRNNFDSSEVIHEAKARLLGVELAVPRVPITENLFITKLSLKELNERQPYTDLPLLNQSNTNLLGHFAEARMTLRIPVDNEIEEPILSSFNAAQSDSEKAFNGVVSALRLYKSGTIELGPISIASFIFSATLGKIYSLYVSPHNKMLIDDSDIKPLQQAYRLVVACRKDDRVLDRALDRFLMGRQRPNPLDRLIDYVIAWESILLTVNGNPIMDELTYRFGLNGASVLKVSGVEPNCKDGLEMMKGIYSVRSKIVHGMSDIDIDKELKKMGFDNIDALVNDVEERFRRVISWLSTLNVSERPYNKKWGWELLLWGGYHPENIVT